MPLFSKLRAYIDRLLRNSHDHYSWTLPQNSGLLPTVLLHYFFSGIKLDSHHTDVIRQLPPESIIIYITKHKSHLERLFYLYRYRKLGLPTPDLAIFYRLLALQPLSRLFRIWLAHVDYFLRFFTTPDPFESGYVRQKLTAGNAALVSLVESNEFYRRTVKTKTDPLQQLIHIQRTVDRPIYLVPQLLFFGTDPGSGKDRFSDPIVGTEPKPSRIYRLWRILTKSGRVFAEVSEPVNLRAFVQSSANAERKAQELAFMLRHALLEQITRHRQSITGPVLKSTEEVRQHLMTSERLQAYMKSYARRRQTTMAKVTTEALKYVDEIAAAPKPFFLRIGMGVVDWLLNSMFEGIALNQEGLLEMKRASRQGPLIVIPCHKSHVDYLVVSYIMGRNNMPFPHIFAGRNLAFWPMGSFFRWVGAFFVRRSFKGAVFYSKVFAEYIYMLLAQGFNIEVFIEGTRSRSGKMLLPKVGMLAILLNAVKSGAADNVNFVPVFIGYDRVPEEAAYQHEIEGGEKNPENFWQVLKARQLLKKRYGKIYINFGRPISINDLALENEVPVKEMSTKQINRLCRDAGSRVFTAINRRTVVTPQALVSAAILNNVKETITHGDLLFLVDTYLTYLATLEVELAETLILNQAHAVEHILNYYLQSKFIYRVSPDGTGPVVAVQYKVYQNKRVAIDYYKNSCIAHFVPASFTAMAIMVNDSFQFSSTDLYGPYQALESFFSHEFSSDTDRPCEYQVRKTVKAFIDDAILVPHPTLPDTYNLTAQGYRKLKSFAGFLKPFFESYRIVLAYFRRVDKKYDRISDRLSEIQKVGNRMFKRYEVNCKEALSNVTYANAVDFYIKHGVRGAKNTGKIKQYGDLIQSHLNRLNF